MVGASVRLRELIRQIRGTKTAAEERAVIQRESALIRTSFREEDNDSRCKNVAKLLYIYLLGYPAHFGQLECLKLVASPRFIDKRVGYLGVSLLLDERTEVHLLVTNSLKVDMGSHNQHVVSLALNTLATICSTDMARDLADAVQGLLNHQNPYVRKKAALCAVRIIRRVPDMIDLYVEGAKELLQERNHAVMLTGVTLVTEFLRQQLELAEDFKNTVPHLVRSLKNLSQSSYLADHDVNGVTDPFLQVRILRLLRLLGSGDVDTSDIINDVLAQVATNTESARNVGNAILYESVLTIMGIEADSSLRVLAVNILGRFLLNNDKNIRFVALSTLQHCVQIDNTAVQRHRGTIVDCLRDPDVSIRRRAMELIFVLINQDNVRVLVRELLLFLEVADTEFKAYLASNIFIAASRFAPNRRWLMDTCIKVLVNAQNHVKDDVVSGMIQLISASKQLYGYATQRLFHSLNEDQRSQPLAQVSVWAIGEYADLLVAGEGLDADDDDPDASTAVSSHDVMNLLYKVCTSPYSNQVTKDYALNAVVKCTVRLSDITVEDSALKILNRFTSTMDAELQQRAVEYLALYNQGGSLRQNLLERMPAMELSVQDAIGVKKTKGPHTGAAGLEVDAGSAPQKSGDDLLDLLGDDFSTQPAQNGGGAPPAAMGGGLDDLLGGMSMGGGDAKPAAAPAAMGGGLDDLLGGAGGMGGSSNAPSGVGAAMDGGLDDLLGGGGGAAAPAASSAAPAASTTNQNILDLFNSGGSAPPAGGATAAPAATDPGTFTAYQKGPLSVEFACSKSPSNAHVTEIHVTSTNSGMSALSGYNLQAAVPKQFKLQLSSASGTEVPAMNNGGVTQGIKVLNPSGAALKMRLRITYNDPGTGQQTVEQAEISEFPAL
eukprot:Clim_evm33s204 gene=Clim_evmTU33s204